ncbi:uncharacterized protein LOC129573412 [Sitodiplosis mosellana]|uniref:uncharacterized protein LOC129573412 n=1 Tax=Sitodiplosis mosellana TaxID=263140 RepID=UPI00244489CE|nr:uncharacterized protein LOC129573412 [Sitodiplosis mosellana]
MNHTLARAMQYLAFKSFRPAPIFQCFLSFIHSYKFNHIGIFSSGLSHECKDLINSNWDKFKPRCSDMPIQAFTRKENEKHALENCLSHLASLHDQDAKHVLDQMRRAC